MDREKLNRYKKNKREIAMIERQLDRLQERLETVGTILGKVTKSGDDFPYIEEHITVQMAEPNATSGIKDRIRAREARIKVLKNEIEEVEDFIEGLPEGIEKSVLELVYLEGMSQNDVAEAVGYTQARVSQIIRDTIKDL